MEEELKENLVKDLNKKIEKEIKSIVDEGIQVDNINMLGKLVDIHKDLANEEYWKNKEEVMGMRYREYGNYPREMYGRRRRDSRGRYADGDMGRRMYPDDMMNEMYEGYQRYADGREQYNRGNYGAKEETMKSLEYMLQSLVDFVEKLKDEAGSQEEMELIREYTKQISEL